MASSLISTIQNVLRQFEGLSHDVDPNDSQDNTKKNTRGLAVNLEELTTILQAMQQSDVEDLMKEYGDIFAGRETLQKNIQDINAIIERVRTRAAQNTGAQKKVEKSLTGSSEGHDFSTFIRNYQQVLSQLSQVVNQKQRHAA